REPFVDKYLGAELAARARAVLDFASIFDKVGGYPLFFRNVLADINAEFRDENIDENAASSERLRRLDLASLSQDERSQLSRMWDRIIGSAQSLDPDAQRLRQRTIEFLCCASAPGLTVAILRPLLEASLKRPLDHSDVLRVLTEISQYLKEDLPGHYLPF